MSTPRRTILRTPRPEPPPPHPRLQKLRARLEREQTALARWMTRLKRSFHAFERQQGLVARIERQLAREETTNHDTRDG